jgi:hypothetical protein
MSQEERDAYNNSLRIVEQELVSETNTFWYFVIGAIFGLLLIILLIYCLVHMKKKNDLIVAKVEKLEAGVDSDLSDSHNDDFYNSRRR